MKNIEKMKEEMNKSIDVLFSIKKKNDNENAKNILRKIIDESLQNEIRKFEINISSEKISVSIRTNNKEIKDEKITKIELVKSIFYIEFEGTRINSQNKIQKNKKLVDMLLFDYIGYVDYKKLIKEVFKLFYIAIAKIEKESEETNEFVKETNEFVKIVTKNKK